MSYETIQSIVKDTQSRMTNSEYKEFLKALIDTLYIGNDVNNRESFLSDLIECINVTKSDSIEPYNSLDTAVRDDFIDAYKASQM